MKPTLVLTRPERQSREIAAVLGAQVRAIVSPVMEITGTGAAPDLSAYGGVILTSANAVPFSPALSGVPVWCVGRRAAEAAAEAGATVQLVARNADDLVARVSGTGKRTGKLIHLRGEHARGDVVERLNSAGIETDESILYQQHAMALSDAARAAIEGSDPVILPLYSPRSARLVGAQLRAVGPQVQTIAMSPAVAEAWREATGLESVITNAPTGEAMLALIQGALRP